MAEERILHRFRPKYIVEFVNRCKTNYYLLNLYSKKTEGEYGTNRYKIHFIYKVSNQKRLLFNGEVVAKNITSAQNQVIKKHFTKHKTIVSLFSAIKNSKRFQNQWDYYPQEVQNNYI